MTSRTFLICFTAMVMSASGAFAASRSHSNGSPLAPARRGVHFSPMAGTAPGTFRRWNGMTSSGQFRNWNGNWNGRWNANNWHGSNWHRHWNGYNNVVVFGGGFGYPWYYGYPYYGSYYPYGGYPAAYVDVSYNANGEPNYYGTNNGGSSGQPGYSGNGGNSSSVVGDVQRRLASDGYYHGAIDGDMGPRTFYAIRAYQRDHQLRADGQINQPLLAAMRLR